MKEGYIKETGNSALTAWLLLQEALHHNGLILYLVEEDDRKQSVWQNLLLLKQIYLPTLTVHHGFDGKTLWLLTHTIPSVIVMTRDESEGYCVPPDEYRNLLRGITVGKKVTPRVLGSQLQSLGYIPRASDPLPGEFTSRGGNMILNDSLSEKLYILEFDEDRIMSMTPYACIVGPLVVQEGVATVWSYVNDEHYVIKEMMFGGNDRTSVEHLHDLTPERTKQLLVELLPKGYTVIAAAKKQDTLSRMFELLSLSEWKDRIHIVHPRPRSSYPFIDHAHHLLFITDEDIIPILTIERALREKKIRAPIKDRISVGDYLVHFDHGVGIFKGFTMIDDEGLPKEYFILEYAASDKLYVPLTLEEKLDIYLGSSHPVVNRLSTTTWEETKVKAKEDIQEMAQELLSIYAVREISNATALPPHDDEVSFASACSFTLTLDQEKTILSVMKDLESDIPSDRLVCGDVGFGKTEVALRAVLRAVGNHAQVAVVCPTTILAHQHYETFLSRLEPFGVRIELLSRMKTKEAQQHILSDLSSGTIDVIIGTHRLLQHDVEIPGLGLAIIDEEQRFGVKQKEHLKKLRTGAHVLSLSATPIPRTLNLALSGLRSVSIITTPPPGRLGIETHIHRYNEEMIRKAIERERERNGQIFYLYNKVDTMRLKLRELTIKYPTLRIRVAHGQLPQEELLSTMDAFSRGEADMLLATTIIENGLDMPNVNTLIVENATQFGLSSLHQLRGRIGRSDRQAYAYFFYTENKLGDLARERLQALEDAKDVGAGFNLAMRDMEIRGVGSVLGSSQHGHVVAIGLNLYLELLEQEIAKIRAK